MAGEYDRRNLPHTESISARIGAYALVPSYGWLETIEIILHSPAMNMDSSKPLKLFVELRDGDGHLVPFEMRMTTRSVS